MKPATGFPPSPITMAKASVAAAAVLAALYLHLRYFLVLPDPIFSPDSVGYYMPALSKLFSGQLALDPLRTPAYPLFLWAILKWTGLFSGVLIVQHLIHIATAALTGAMLFRFFGRGWLASTLAAAWVLALPRQLIYSHYIMTDAPYVMVFLASLSALWLARDGRTLALSALAGALAVLATAVRPVGISLMVAVVLAAWFLFEKSRRRAALLGAAAGVLIVAGGWISYNGLARGFWGLTAKNSEVLFGSAASWVELDDLDADVRKALEPLYTDPARTAQLHDHAWVMYQPGGPVAELRAAGWTGSELDSLLGRLAGGAISAHPFRYAGHIIADIGRYVAFGSRRPARLIPKHLTIADGLRSFWQATRMFPEAIRLMAFRPDTFRDTIAGIARTPLYPFETAGLLRPVWEAVASCGAWLPLASLGMAAWLIGTGRHRRLCLLFLAVGVLHLALCSVGAGVDGRYALPLEPLYVLMFVAGATDLWSRWRARRPPSARAARGIRPIRAGKIG